MITPTPTQARRARFSLDENSIAHLQSVLAGLYEDRETAILRELSINGYDAQVEAGREGEPVKVELPHNDNDNTLTIADTGVGMTEDQLFDLYSKYGASSKRGGQRPAVTGMLGLGSKAPLALVDKFTVTSVKDGVRVVVEVEKDPDGVASLTVVESTAGADGSGTTISIPVPEANNFREKASALFRFWPEGSILVDGSAPPALAGEDLGDMFTLVKGETKDYVVMGNVPYPVNIPSGYQTEGLLKVKSYHRKYGLVARIPLGSVHFTPSREALNYTPATVEYLMGVRQRFRETLVEKMVDEVNLAQTKTDALRTLVVWSRRTLGEKLPDLWWGNPIPSSFQVPRIVWSGVDEDKDKGRRTSTDYVSRLEAEEIFSGYDPDAVTSVFITGWDHLSGKRITPTVKAKVRELLRQKGYTRVQHVHFALDFSGTDGWFDGVPTFDMETVKAIKTPRGKLPARPKQGTRLWQVWNDNERKYVKTASADFKDKKLVLYASPPDMVFGNYYATKNVPPSTVLLLAGQTDTVFVLVNKNQWGTFLRENPRAIHFHKWRADAAAELMATVTPRDLAFHHLGGGNYPAQVLNPRQVLDPELAEWVEAIHDVMQHQGKNPNTALTGKVTQFAQIGMNVVWPEWDTPNPAEKYPLMRHISMWDLDKSAKAVEHMTLYVNAVWRGGHTTR